MYRLMKSEKTTLSHQDSGSVSFYRQIQVFKYSSIQVSKLQKLSDALVTCKTASDNAGARYFIFNELAKEYYDVAWID
jgi:hypothetical protein